jgi:uncharacterized protein YukE
MSWYGDPDALDRLAGALGEQAVHVREQAGSVRSLPARAHWRGPAADAFHASVTREALALDRTAEELEDAAQALRAHAASVREQVARIRALEHAITSWFSSQVSRVEHVFADLPLPGAKEWVEVGEYLRGRGVPV